MFAPPYLQSPPDQVVVTANRIETSEDEIASSVSTVSSEDLDRKQKDEVSDYLREVLGLSVTNSGGPGKPTSVFVRGADPNAVLVLIDGVEMNDALSTGAGYHFGNLSAQDLDRIEVIRGSQSVLYGSGATGGVIQIFTKKGSGPLKSTFEAEYGTYQSWRLHGNVRGGQGPFRYYLGAGHVGTEGFPASDQALGNRLNNGQQLTTLTGNFALKVSPQTTLDLSTRFSSSQFTFSNGGPPGYSSFGLRTGDDPGYSGTDEQGYAKIGLRSKVSELWQPQGAVTYSLDSRTSEHTPNPVNEVHSHFSFNSGRVRGLFQNDMDVSDSQTVTVGLDAALERGTSVETSSQWKGDLGLQDRSASVIGVFTQDRWKFGESFGTFGARADFHQYAGNALTYRFAPGYRFEGTQTTLRASVGTGFKSPSLYQLFSHYGNVHLSAERSTSYDLGVDQEVGGTQNKVSLTLFRANYEGLIQFDFQSGPGRFANLHQAHTEGIELGLQFELSRWFFTQLSYNYLVAVDDGTNLPLLRRPTHQMAYELIYGRNDRVEVGFSLRWVGDRKDIDEATGLRVWMPPYTVAGLMVHYRPNERLDVFGRIDNLFNLSYQEVYGYGTPLRSFFIGTRYII